MPKKGQKGRRALDDAGEAELCRRYLAGESIRGLAESMEVARGTVSNVLKRHGVTADQREFGQGAGSAGGNVVAIGDAAGHRAASIAAYAELGDPPEDPLAAMGWLRRVYLLQLKLVATDPDYPGSESQRRKEIRELGRAAAAAKDEDAIARVRDQLIADRERRERRGGAEIVNGQVRNARARLRTARRRKQPG